jgi:hypothetical protein
MKAIKAAPKVWPLLLREADQAAEAFLNSWLSVEM